MKTAVIIPAAGKGQRMGADIEKQFLSLNGKPIIAHTVRVFQSSPSIDLIYPVLPPYLTDSAESVAGFAPGQDKIAAVVAGGEARQDSVANGLKALAPDVDIVLVHDGVRPFITERLIQDCIATASAHGACLAALQAQETVKRTDDEGVVTATLPRDLIYLAQTPQTFRRDVLELAFRRAREDAFYGTDEAMLVERLGLQVRVVPGERWNIKITNPEDLTWARVYAETQARRPGAGEAV